MKLSIKFQDDPLNDDQHRQIMTAKVPTTIFNQPFVSGIVATTTDSASDFAFSLSTNFPSGPSLKLSYTPTATNTTALPLSLSLKSGLGVSGSPRHSPLVFSARFSLSPSYVPVPTFFLHFRPQFGHFSLDKTVFSDPNTDQISRSASDCRELSSLPSLDGSEIGGKRLADGSFSSGWQEVKLEPSGGKDEGSNFAQINNREGQSNGTIGSTPERIHANKRSGVSSGIAIMARTAMPVTKGLSLNLRWGLNFPGIMGLKMPSLTVNKIRLEWVTEAKKNKWSADTAGGDLHLLKGMYSSMQRDLESVEKENRAMKQILDEMKKGVAARNRREEGNGIGEKFSQHSGESSSEFERWRSKKNAKEEKGQREPTKFHSLASDLESELQKAIKVASS
ncbi:uncharacterized protein LOC129321560 [Prosopis cineraria]|uniref:uncharacterized protein LOC129321560 n=1 Tax=Prosopis cineraria TaxID=364024 RepID=UPI00240F456A|nr:uncharacterized protein LOC129321560 [Prosopis cineraria]XP_054823337.1 uncharacterized protein LOC129321560 [Prosopis cineraria]XP_054823338.1 uncharacterized protein LOC129321560 [Prosopis cineraria]XP_054823339.1 uncharacterized protein LOC129321560 [Prosopis cineraria]